MLTHEMSHVRSERAEGRVWERLLVPHRRRTPDPLLLRTHPPTEGRIRRLLELAPQGGRARCARGGARLPALPARDPAGAAARPRRVAVSGTARSEAPRTGAHRAASGPARPTGA